MNHREREYAALNFLKPIDRGPVEETFYPWTLTVERFREEGIPEDICNDFLNYPHKAADKYNYYLDDRMAEPCANFEEALGFEPVKRFFINPPFVVFDSKTIEENDEYIIHQHANGWHYKHYKHKDVVEEHKPPVCNEEDWNTLKNFAKREIEEYFTDDNIEKVFGKYVSDQRCSYTIRMGIQGFFWVPRTLFGVEGHMYAFYDYPEVMHEINTFMLDFYFDRLGKVLDTVEVDVLYIMEDLSGANGPMLSPELFDEFVGQYYERLVPFLKNKGVTSVLVDTDGDFIKLIPNFMKYGIEGFLPVDVNAGVDIVKVREMFPRVKLIGGFNKLCIAEGRVSIDKEFDRLLPVIRQGGYVPGCDHQVPPSAPLENYIYYIKKLKEVMTECGSNL